MANGLFCGVCRPLRLSMLTFSPMRLHGCCEGYMHASRSCRVCVTSPLSIRFVLGHEPSKLVISVIPSSVGISTSLHNAPPLHTGDTRLLLSFYQAPAPTRLDTNRSHRRHTQLVRARLKAAIHTCELSCNCRPYLIRRPAGWPTVRRSSWVSADRNTYEIK